MSKRNWQIVLLATFVVSMTQCRNNADKNNKSDVLLARAYDKSLYLSQLEGVVPEGIRGQDSLMRIYAYAYQWVNDQLLMYEAERNIPKDIDIDQLVRDYRASLVKHNYEEHIIAQKLDTVVTEREQETFYNENRDQFQLESTILKCLFLKMPNDAPQNELNKIWYNRSDTQLEGLKKYAAKWAVRSFLEPKKWYKLEEVAANLPKSTLTSENVQSRREGTLSDGDFRYYYRVLDVAQGKSIAPLDYARDKATKIILHRRKQELFTKWRNELYDQEVTQKNAEILIKATTNQ
jgi:hypothetical protein